MPTLIGTSGGTSVSSSPDRLGAKSWARKGSGASAAA
jgi:hypothetical protein